MSHAEWFYALVGGASVNAAAVRAGLVQTTLARHLKEGRLTPDEVIALSRTYGVDVLDALLECGLLTLHELHARPIKAALSAATDEELADEVLRRLHDRPHGPLSEPLTD